MMTNNLAGTIIFFLIIIVVVIIFFAVIDRLLKGGTKKSVEKKSAPRPEKPKPEPTTEAKTLPTMKIYNSELADDLNAMLKGTDTYESSRLQIKNHINKEGNIAKYLKDKHYRGFDFDVDNNTVVDDEPFSFTREDYKRIMALSNIDDKKSL